MSESFQFRPGRWAGASLISVLTFAGCGPTTPLARSGIALTPPTGWSAVAADTWAVPGTPVAAWKGPERSSLVVYRTLWAPGTTSEATAQGLANRLDGLPGLKVVKRGVETVGGVESAWVEAVGPGTGDAFVPSGAGVPVAPAGSAIVPTRRIVVVIPRPSETLTLVWHAPEAQAAALANRARTTTDGLKLSGGSLATSGY